MTTKIKHEHLDSINKTEIPEESEKILESAAIPEGNKSLEIVEIPEDIQQDQSDEVQYENFSVDIREYERNKNNISSKFNNRDLMKM